MKRKFFVLFIITALAVSVCLSACGKEEDEPANEPAEAPEELEVDASAYGYSGDDPITAAAYIYLTDVVAGNFEPADACIPTVDIFAVDFSENDDDIIVYGDFLIDNYKIDGDTLRTVSGGHFPGVMHVNSENVVTAFDQVADGGEFDASAEELYGEYYEDFKEVYADDKTREDLRKEAVQDYVKTKGLSVTQYQDEGQDPVLINE